ncbi:MAG: class I SAM-dependent methyltransferase [Akkermansiaceae bacterium]|nr:class I SAM-dependent methyltransferase [Akkermansiaceae bacterium]
MEFSERRRLVFYVSLLLLVIGGMVYLSRVKDEDASKVSPTPDSVEQLSPVDSPAEVYQPKACAYDHRQASRDGTGKVYMGREISEVMGHAAIHWLERPEREAEEATSRVMKGLAKELKPDAVIVDVGSGSGYYSFQLANLVPQGKVIGVDIQPEMVDFLVQKAKRLGVNNVEANLGKVDSVQLPSESVDAAIMVDAYHEFSHPNEMMQSIVHALKFGGRVYLLEYRAEDDAVPIKPLHKMTEAQSIKEMEAVGLKHLKTEGFLPWQHFMIFEK